MIAFLLLLMLILFPGTVCGVSGRAETVWERINEEQSQNNIFYGYHNLMSGDYSRAALEFKAAINKNPKNAYARIGYGSALYWMGMADKAYDEFDQAIQLDPKNADAYQLRGIIKSYRGQYQSALEDFQYAAKYSPRRGDVRMNIGSVYAAIGDIGTALINYRRAVSMDGNNPLFHLQLARCYVSLGRDSDAEKSYRKAISLYPDYEDAIFELAILLEGAEKYVEALGLYKKAVRIKAGDSVARFRLAALLYRMGRKKEIRKIIMPGFAIAPPNEKGGISMGFSYSKNGENDKGNGNKSGTGGQGASKEQKEEYPKAADILERVPASHEVKMIFELVELPKTELKQKTGSERNLGIGNKMSVALRKPEMKYVKKEYLLPPSSGQERLKRIALIQKETEELVKNVSSKNDVRISISMETSSSGDDRVENLAPGYGDGNYSHFRQDSNEKQKKPRYIPRDVGNDMRLWIYGENWFENVAEFLDEWSGKKNLPPEMLLVRGLGYLLMGETSLAAEDFSGHGIAESLGRSAAYTASGNMKKAIEECEKVLAADPKNHIAAQNLKWLKYKPEDEKKHQE